MFNLNNVEFEINDTESIFYIENQNGFSFALDVDCKPAEYNGVNVTPAICINILKQMLKAFMI